MKQIFVLFILIGQSLCVYAQDEVIDHTRLALKAGSSKDLAKYFNDMVDVTFNGEKGSYSKAQAEFILKDFLKRILL